MSKRPYIAFFLASIFVCVNLVCAAHSFSHHKQNDDKASLKISAEKTSMFKNAGEKPLDCKLCEFRFDHLQSIQFSEDICLLLKSEVKYNVSLQDKARLVTEAYFSLRAPPSPTFFS